MPWPSALFELVEAATRTDPGNSATACGDFSWRAHPVRRKPQSLRGLRAAVMRLSGFFAKKHHRSRAFGGEVIAFASVNQLGLIRLDGTVVVPGPFRAWRVVSNGDGEWCR